MPTSKKQKKLRRHDRVRSVVKGGNDRPRLSVYKSNRHLFVQLIDDENGKTLISASDRELKIKSQPMKKIAYELGKLIAKKAGEKKIISAVFDRGGYRYHGAVLELARGAREGGLKF